VIAGRRFAAAAIQVHWDLKLQAQQLRLEIAERKKAEQEIKTLSLAAIESLGFLRWKPKINIPPDIPAG